MVPAARRNGAQRRFTVQQYKNALRAALNTYPSFALRAPGVRMQLMGEASEAVSRSISAGGSTTGTYRIVTVSPGEAWSRKIYAQRFLPPIPSGPHEIGYEVTLTVVGPIPSSDEVLQASGTFALTVADRSDAKLLTILDSAERKYFMGNLMESRESEECLTLTPSPLVLPVLSRMADEAGSAAAILALANFRGEPLAAEILLRAAKSGKPLLVSAALDVAQDWMYPLAAGDLGLVLAAGTKQVKLRALAFAKALPRAEYLSVVSAYAWDPDPSLSEVAQSVQREIARRQK